MERMKDRLTLPTRRIRPGRSCQSKRRQNTRSVKDSNSCISEETEKTRGQRVRANLEESISNNPLYGRTVTKVGLNNKKGRDG